MGTSSGLRPMSIAMTREMHTREIMMLILGRPGWSPAICPSRAGSAAGAGVIIIISAHLRIPTSQIPPLVLE